MALSASISSKHFSWIELFTFRCSSASKDVRFIYINSVTATLMRFQSTHSSVIQQQRAVAVALSFTFALKLSRELQWAYCSTWKHRVWFDWRSSRFQVLWKGTKLHGWNWYVEHKMCNIELDIIRFEILTIHLRLNALRKLQSIVQWRSKSAREDPDLLFEWVSIRISNGNSMHISCASSQERKSHGIQLRRKVGHPSRRSTEACSSAKFYLALGQSFFFERWSSSMMVIWLNIESSINFDHLFRPSFPPIQHSPHQASFIIVFVSF